MNTKIIEMNEATAGRGCQAARGGITLGMMKGIPLTGVSCVWFMTMPEIHHFCPIVTRKIFPQVDGRLKQDALTRPATNARVWRQRSSRPYSNLIQPQSLRGQSVSFTDDLDPKRKILSPRQRTRKNGITAQLSRQGRNDSLRLMLNHDCLSILRQFYRGGLIARRGQRDGDSELTNIEQELCIYGNDWVHEGLRERMAEDEEDPRSVWKEPHQCGYVKSKLWKSKL